MRGPAAGGGEFEYGDQQVMGNLSEGYSTMCLFISITSLIIFFIIGFVNMYFI